MGQVAQHELDSAGPMDPERKIQLQTEIQVLSSNLELLGVNPVADNNAFLQQCVSSYLAT